MKLRAEVTRAVGKFYSEKRENAERGSKTAKQNHGKSIWGQTQKGVPMTEKQPAVKMAGPLPPQENRARGRRKLASGMKGKGKSLVSLPTKRLPEILFSFTVKFINAVFSIHFLL